MVAESLKRIVASLREETSDFKAFIEEVCQSRFLRENQVLYAEMMQNVGVLFDWLRGNDPVKYGCAMLFLDELVWRDRTREIIRYATPHLLSFIARPDVRPMDKCIAATRLTQFEAPLGIPEKRELTRVLAQLILDRRIEIKTRQSAYLNLCMLHMAWDSPETAHARSLYLSEGNESGAIDFAHVKQLQAQSQEID